MSNRPRIIVIGDIMLDIYRYGDVERISPEAPVPVVHIKKSEKGLGGAGNTFSNLLEIGSNSFLIGMVGRDSYGLVEIPSIFHEKYPKDQDEYYFYQSIVHPTIVKERVIARTQQICRMDWENGDDPLPQVGLQKICTALDIHCEVGCDVMLISDYGKGVINSQVMDAICKLKKEHNFQIVLDPHPKNAHIYREIDFATPNQKEFDEIGLPEFWNMGCQYILRTEGAGGMTLINRENSDHHIDTEAQEIFDVSGAGDTVCAVFAHMLAHRFSVVQSMDVANKCAGIVVAKQGTVPIHRNEFDKILRRIK